MKSNAPIANTALRKLESSALTLDKTENAAVVEFLSATVEHAKINKVGMGTHRTDFNFRGEACRIVRAPKGDCFVVFVLGKKAGQRMAGASGGAPLFT